MNKDEFHSHIDRERLRQAIETHGTPAYLYFSSIIETKAKVLRRCLPSRFNISYAVKANPHPGVLKIMASLGFGADVASIGEFEAARVAGIAAERIEFSGPGKTEDELARAIEAGVGSINAESLAEIELLARLAEQSQTRANVAIRINPIAKGVKSGIKMAGATQFGIPEEQVSEATRLIESSASALAYTGIHAHAGSQIFDAESIVAHYRSVLDAALDIEDASSLAMKKINVGGGWGVNVFPNQSPLDLVAVERGLSDLFGESKYESLTKRANLIAEPGRFLVGECGVYATTVLYTKQSRGKQFVIVDGGLHHNYVLAGGMGQVIRRNFEMDVLASGERKAAPCKFDVAGRLCTPQDILALGFEHDQEIAPGDRIVFFNAGAYGATASPVNFLSHAPPLEVIVS